MQFVDFDTSSTTMWLHLASYRICRIIGIILWSIIHYFGIILMSFWHQMWNSCCTPFWHDVGIILYNLASPYNQLCVILGSMSSWHQCGIILASLDISRLSITYDFDISLKSFWNQCGALFWCQVDIDVA